MEDCPGDPEPSFHAGRERSDGVVSAVFEVYERQEFVDPVAWVIEIVEPGVVGQVVCGAQPVGKAVVLEEDADLCAGSVVDGEVAAENPALTGAGGEEPEQDPDGCGLSGAVGAEVAEDLTVGDGEGDVAEDLPAVKRTREPADVDGVHGRHLRRTRVLAAI